MEYVKLSECPVGTFYYCGITFNKHADGSFDELFASGRDYEPLTPDTVVMVGLPVGSTVYGTPADTKDARQKCVRGIKYARNSLARVDAEIVKGAKDLLSVGEDEKKVAAAYGLTVRKLRNLLR